MATLVSWLEDDTTNSFVMPAPWASQDAGRDTLETVWGEAAWKRPILRARGKTDRVRLLRAVLMRRSESMSLDRSQPPSSAFSARIPCAIQRSELPRPASHPESSLVPNLVLSLREFRTMLCFPGKPSLALRRCPYSSKAPSAFPDAYCS